MPVLKTDIEGLLVVEWNVIEDSRGFFKHTYQFGELAAALGRDPRLRQGNHSRSRPGVLRGFHLEPWDKLIYVPHGHAMCVVVDPRPESPTFGRHLAFELGDAPGRRDRLLISKGLANAFYCHTEVDYLNDVSEEFDPSNRRGFLWNDPDLAIDWPIDSPILSPQDMQLPRLRDLLATPRR
jgi:dTDP-4-dehydrorhamnose 3,5-epimerase